MKLRRIDKWGAAVAIGLLLVIGGWRYLPLQKCEVHGEWLKRERTNVLYGHMAMTWDYAQATNQAQNRLFPHDGHHVQQAKGTAQHSKIELMRYCAQCRYARVQWYKQNRTVSRQWK